MEQWAAQPGSPFCFLLERKLLVFALKVVFQNGCQIALAATASQNIPARTSSSPGVVYEMVLRFHPELCDNVGLEELPWGSTDDGFAR